jgi:hypothetical protein
MAAPTFLAAWDRVCTLPGVVRNPSMNAWQRKVLAPAGAPSSSSPLSREASSLVSSSLVATFNPEHLKTKRPASIAAAGAAAAVEIPVVRPFNPDGFHFGKVKASEVVVRFRLSLADTPPGQGGDDAITWASGRDADAEGGADAPLGSFPDGEHAVLVNASPLFRGHGLLVPYLHALHPQVVSDPVRHVLPALRLGRLIGGGPGGRPDFRLGFNSLGAFASVNHFHIHTAFAADIFPSGGRFPVEGAPREEELASRDLGSGERLAVQTLAWHLPGFVFTVSPGGSPSSSPDNAALAALASASGSLLAALARAGTPHHFLVADAGRAVYVLPRTKQRPSFGGRAQIALAEVCGLAIFTDPSAYGGEEGEGEREVTLEEFVAELRSLALEAGALEEVARLAAEAVRRVYEGGRV